MKLFCRHKWNCTQWRNIEVLNDYGKKMRMDSTYTLVCTKCGKLHTKRLRGVELGVPDMVALQKAKGWVVQ